MKNTYWETFTNRYQMGEQIHRMYVLERLMRDEVKSLFDVGCGTGPMGEIIQQHNYPIKYKGTDYSHSMIEVCKKEMPGMDFEVQDMRDLKEEDESWECVLLMHSLDHTDDYAKSISEAARVSSKYVYIVLWRPLMESGTHVNNINKIGKKEDEDPYEDTHLQEYSLESLQKEFDASGLKLVEVINDERINDGKYNTLFILEK